MASMLVTKKTLKSMGGKMNESSGSAVSAFARRQMEKFGWTEGKGLGKNEDGIQKHVKIVKRDENTGLGSEAKPVDPEAETWWHDAFANALSKVSTKKKRKRSEQSSSSPPTYDELFAATGGVRLGMRARADQVGKLSRVNDFPEIQKVSRTAESSDVASSKSDSESGSPSTCISNGTTEQQSSNSIEQTKDRKEKKSKKEKKEKSKKEKKEKKLKKSKSKREK